MMYLTPTIFDELSSSVHSGEVRAVDTASAKCGRIDGDRLLNYRYGKDIVYTRNSRGSFCWISIIDVNLQVIMRQHGMRSLRQPYKPCQIMIASGKNGLRYAS
jgi:hypothetical protein